MTQVALSMNEVENEAQKLINSEISTDDMANYLKLNSKLCKAKVFAHLCTKFFDVRNLEPYYKILHLISVCVLKRVISLTMLKDITKRLTKQMPCFLKNKQNAVDFYSLFFVKEVLYLKSKDKLKPIRQRFTQECITKFINTAIEEFGETSYAGLVIQTLEATILKIVKVLSTVPGITRGDLSKFIVVNKEKLGETEKKALDGKLYDVLNTYSNSNKMVDNTLSNFAFGNFEYEDHSKAEWFKLHYVKRRLLDPRIENPKHSNRMIINNNVQEEKSPDIINDHRNSRLNTINTDHRNTNLRRRTVIMVRKCTIITPDCKKYELTEFIRNGQVVHASKKLIPGWYDYNYYHGRRSVNQLQLQRVCYNQQQMIERLQIALGLQHELLQNSPNINLPSLSHFMNQNPLNHHYQQQQRHFSVNDVNLSPNLFYGNYQS